MVRPDSLLKGFEKKVPTIGPNPKKRVTLFDESTTGLCLLVTPRGRKTFTLVARGPAQDGGKPGKQVWKEIGQYPAMSIEEARKKAREGLPRVKAGLDPFPPIEPEPEPEPVKVETFKDVADAFLDRHVHKKNQGVPALRSARLIERQFEALIGPEWNSRPFADIDRHDVVKLRDKIATGSGPVMADRVLATLSTLFRQQQDYMPKDWHPPAVRRLTNGGERARSRVLFDVNRDDKELYEAGRELRLLWQAAERSGSFGALVRLLILTAQRRTKVAAMKWDDLDLQRGTWTISTEKREKGNAEMLKLPPMALAIIKAQPRVDGNDYVFAGRGKAHLTGYSPLKKALDAKISEANDGKTLPAWEIHDLRRTARTLMSRAGVTPHVSERLLGHALGQMEKVYEHYNWPDAKAKALVKLAALIHSIVTPREGNVVQFRKDGAS